MTDTQATASTSERDTVATLAVMVQQLRDAGWPVTAEMVITKEGRFVAVLGCELGMTGLAPDVAHLGSVLPLVPASAYEGLDD